MGKVHDIKTVMYSCQKHSEINSSFLLKQVHLKSICRLKMEVIKRNWLQSLFLKLYVFSLHSHIFLSTLKHADLLLKTLVQSLYLYLQQYFIVKWICFPCRYDLKRILPFIVLCCVFQCLLKQWKTLNLGWDLSPKAKVIHYT
jgi:hypothetical protein